MRTDSANRKTPGKKKVLRSTVLAIAGVVLIGVVAFPLYLLGENQKSMDTNYRKDENWKRNWGVRWFSIPYDTIEFLSNLKRNITGPEDTHRSLTPYAAHRFALNQRIDNNLISSSIKNIKIGFLGDVMPMKGKRWVLSKEAGDFFQNIDYLVVNFEGSLGSGPFSLMHQRHDEHILEDLTAILPAEKIILSVANNHAADFDFSGFEFTREKLKQQGFMVIGDRETPDVMIEDSINIVAATQWTNQHHGYLSFLENAKQSCVPGKLNILYPHWGYEMELFPRPEWIQLAGQYLESYDLIVGHHSHVPGPVHIYKNKQGIEKVVAYSLGDSATGMDFKYYQKGVALVMESVFGPTGVRLTGGSWRYTRLVQQKHQAVLMVDPPDDQSG